jgi:aminoglycoside phosphotransferase (APT) family kinase protein
VRLTAEARSRIAVARVLGVKPTDIVAHALSIREVRQVYRCSGAGRVVVAKCYPDAGRAAHAAGALEALGGHHGVLQVPRCWGIDMGMAVVVQEHISGEALGRHLAGPCRDRVMELASAALGELHRLPVQLESWRLSIRSRGRLERDACFEQAAAAVGRLPADRAQIAAEALERAGQLLGESVQLRVPSHGDFGWSQLIGQGGSVALVDFDKAGMAERGLDLGNLLAQTVRSGLEPAHASALLSGYADSTGVEAARPAIGYSLLILARKLDHLPEARVAEIQGALEAILSWERTESRRSYTAGGASAGGSGGGPCGEAADFGSSIGSSDGSGALATGSNSTIGSGERASDGSAARSRSPGAATDSCPLPDESDPPAG